MHYFHMRCVLPVSLCWILFYSMPVMAASMLSEKEAVAHALKFNPQLSIVEQQQAAAAARLGAVEGESLPRIDFSYQLRRSDNALDVFADNLNTRDVDPANDFTSSALNHPDASVLQMARLSLNWPVYTGGQLQSQVTAAQALAQGARYDKQHVYAQIIHATLSTYVQIQAMQQNVLQLDDAVTAAQAHVSTTSRLVREGRIINSDQLTAEVFLSSMQTAREQAQVMYRQAKTRLRKLIGSEEHEDFIIEAMSGPEPAPELSGIESAWQQALSQRQDLAALRAQRDAARAELDARRAVTGPRVDLVLNQDWYDVIDGEQSSSWTVAGVVSMNLFDGGTQQQGVKASESSVVVKSAELTDLKQLIRSEIEDAYVRYKGAQERLSLSKTHVAKARSNVKQITERYGQGRTLLIDVLQAEKSLVEIRRQRLEALLDLKLASLDLNRANGKLLQQYLPPGVE